VHPEAGRIENETTGDTLACEPIPPHLMQMVRDGGLLPHLEKRLGKRHDTP
jgi:3-isopropylmalate/(R)-2-methylmalate dehydratase small subunit